MSNLVVLIHGLGGSADKTWGVLRELLCNDDDFESLDIDTYEYPTAMIRFPFSRQIPHIQMLSRGLKSLINAKWANAERIILVGHSLGGLIARQYLLEETKAERPLKVHKLILLASPNNGADLARIGNLISWQHRQLRQLCRQSEFITLLNDDWANLRMQERFDTLYVVAGQDAVVDETSARHTWGTKHFEVVINKTHSEIIKPTGYDDLAYQIIRRFLLLPTSNVENLTRLEIRTVSVELALVLQFVVGESSQILGFMDYFAALRRRLQKCTEAEGLAKSKFEKIRKLLPNEAETRLERFIGYHIKNYLDDLNLVLPIPGQDKVVSDIEPTKKWRYGMLDAWKQLQEDWIDQEGLRSLYEEGLAKGRIWDILGYNSVEEYHRYLSPDTKSILARGQVQDSLLVKYLSKRKTVTEDELRKYGFHQEVIVDVINALITDKLVTPNGNHGFVISELVKDAWETLQKDMA